MILPTGGRQAGWRANALYEIQMYIKLKPVLYYIPFHYRNGSHDYHQAVYEMGRWQDADY
jgi:hypothetical protein